MNAQRNDSRRGPSPAHRWWVVIGAILVGVGQTRAGECGAVGDLYVTNGDRDNILQFDSATGDFVCIFASGPELDGPDDLVWAPNGHLWVLGVLGTPAVIEYDGQTGQFRRFVVPPAETPPLSLVFSLGGPFGNFFFPSPVDNIINIVEVDRSTEQTLGIVLWPEPPLAGPDKGRFASNGNYLLVGKSFLAPIPTFSEYDGWTFELVQHIAIDTGRKEGVVETLDGASYLVSLARRQHHQHR